MAIGLAFDGEVPPPQHKCKYKTGKCSNERSSKRNGQPHMLCLYHREKANKIQRKFDRQKRQSARMKKASGPCVTDEDDGTRLSLAVASVFSDDEPVVHTPVATTSFSGLLGREVEIYSDSDSSRLSTDSDASSVALEQMWHGLPNAAMLMSEITGPRASMELLVSPAAYHVGSRFRHHHLHHHNHGLHTASTGQLSHEEIDFLYAAMLE